MSKPILALVLVMLSLAGAAHAQVLRLTMIGARAGVSCAEWLSAGRTDEMLEQWAFGFPSAIAAGAQLQTGSNPLASLDTDATHAWL